MLSNVLDRNGAVEAKCFVRERFVALKGGLAVSENRFSTQNTEEYKVRKSYYLRRLAPAQVQGGEDQAAGERRWDRS